ncbi:MAG: ABC transporter substrate-binding protein [Acidimicrobiia bacterium]|nr:ABC transporter substrate-binding protein [Acidimicrobiia bacterium]
MKGLLRAGRLLAVSVLLVAACGGSASPADSGQTDAVEFEPGPLGAVVVAPGELIQIRSLNSISGDIAFLGIPNQRGVEMAIADYGPVAGREVSMGTPLDDLCSPDGGQSAAQATVADPSVIGVIGTTCSSAATAASPLISDAGMVMIAPSNTSPALTSDLAGNPSPSYHPGYYRTAHNDLFQGKAVALFVRDHLGFDTAAAIHDGDPYTQGLAEAFKDAFEELGGMVTAFTAVNKGDTDMIAALTEVAAGRPQALFFPVFMPEGGFIVQQVDGVVGLEDVTLIVSAALLVDNFMELPESEGVYISGPDLRFGDNRNSITGRTAVELLDAYEAAYGEAPSGGYLGHAYDATTMLLRAIERAAVDIDGTLHIDRAQVRDELTGTSMDGIIGPIDCDLFGDCGTQRLTVLYNTDPSNIETGKNNVVFEYAP